MGLLLVRSNSMYFKISGVIVGAAALAPLVFSGMAYLRRGYFAPVDDLLNSAVPAPEISFARGATVEYVPVGVSSYDALKGRVVGILAVCLIVGGLLGWRVKQPAIGDYLKLSVDTHRVQVRAE